MNITKAWHDPIVAEIHAIREPLAKQYQNDLVAYSNAAEEHCRALGLTMAQSPRVIKKDDRGKAHYVEPSSGQVAVG